MTFILSYVVTHFKYEVDIVNSFVYIEVAFKSLKLILLVITLKIEEKLKFNG